MTLKLADDPLRMCRKWFWFTIHLRNKPHGHHVFFYLYRGLDISPDLRWANYHRFTIDLPQIHRNIYIYSVCPPQLGTASCVTNSKRVAAKDRVDGRSYYNMMMILSFWISFGHEFLTKNQNIQNIVFFTLTLAWLQDMHIITQSCTFICERDFCHMYDRQFFIFVDLYRCFLQDRRWRKLPGFWGNQILALSWFW